jgi:hypothetical protein
MSENREGILGALARFGRNRAPQPAPAQNGPTIYPVPPSRKTRKCLATWQDAVVLKQLDDLAHETGTSKQALVAEALNMLMAKYNKPTVAT